MSGNLELRDFNVFVGKSNTGKTMLSILVYALHSYYGRRRFSGFRLGPREDTNVGQLMRQLNTQQQHDLISSIHSQLEKNSKNAVQLSLSNSVLESVHSDILRSNRTLEVEIERCFGTPIGKLVRYQSRTDSYFRVQNVQGAAPDTSGFQYDLKNQRFFCEFPRGHVSVYGKARINRLKDKLVQVKERSGEGRTDPYPIDPDEPDFYDVLAAIIGEINTNVFGRFNSRAHYLPADRTGIMNTHAALVGEIVRNAPSAAIRPGTGTPTLNGVLADFLEELISTNHSDEIRPKTGPNPLPSIADEIESNTLHGEIRATKAEGLDFPTFEYYPRGWKRNLSFVNTSSMVSELAPIVLLLRNSVRINELLIIEQPESHLHPELQVEFLRVLALLVNSGLKILITTHCEWMIEELGNIVSRSKRKTPIYSVYELERQSLRPSEVGVWLFKDQRKAKSWGSVIEEVELDETGAYSAGYENVAMELHNEWAMMFDEEIED